MGYECLLDVVDESGKRIERFPVILYRSFKRGEIISTVVKGQHKEYEVLGEVNLRVKLITAQPTLSGRGVGSTGN